QFLSSHNIRVWYTSAKEFDESCLVPTADHSPDCMFWDCFSWHGLGPIISLYGFPNEKGIFQQDNTPAHKSRKQKAESYLRNSLNKPTSIEDLEKKVKTAWNSISLRYYYELVNSMPNRIKAY
ncbi:13533_t:CDS:2, partial [Cetraspora pellucida]